MRALLLIAIAATAAHADPPKYTRKPPRLELDLRRDDRAKPIVPVEQTPAKPSATADQVLAAQLAADPIRTEQEALLFQLVRDTPDTDPDKPDYLFRLAEHYAQQLRTWRLEAERLRLAK